MKREITRIEPWSAMRVGFFFGLLSGFLFGLFSGSLTKYLANSMGVSVLPPDAQEVAGLSAGAIVALAIMMALIASLAWALLGAIGAVFYNLVARLFGGLELMTSGEQAPQTAEKPSEDEDLRHE